MLNKMRFLLPAIFLFIAVSCSNLMQVPSVGTESSVAVGTSSQPAAVSSGQQSSSAAVRNVGVTLNTGLMDSIDLSMKMKLKLKSPRRFIDAGTIFALVGVSPTGQLVRGLVQNNQANVDIPLNGTWSVMIEETWSGNTNVLLLTFPNAAMGFRMAPSVSNTLDPIDLGIPQMTNGRLVTPNNPADKIASGGNGVPDSVRITNSARSFDNDGDGVMDCFALLDRDMNGIPDIYEVAKGDKPRNVTNLLKSDTNTNAAFVVAALATEPAMKEMYEDAPVFTNAVVRFALDDTLMYYQSKLADEWSNKIVEVALNSSMVQAASAALPNAVAEWSNAIALVATVPAFTNFVDTTELATFNDLQTAVENDTNWAALSTNVVVSNVAPPTVTPDPSSAATSSASSGSSSSQPVYAGDAPVFVVAGCKAQLETGYLDSANEMCSNALLAYPTDPRLHFMYALTLFSRLVGSTAVSNFAADIGFSGLPTSYSNALATMMNGNSRLIGDNIRYLGQPMSSITNPNEQLSNELLYAKNVSNVQALMNDTIFWTMQKMLDSLTVVEARSDFAFDLDVGRIATNLRLYYSGGTTVWRLDSTEVLALDVGVSSLLGAMQLPMAWNLDIDWRKFSAMVTNSRTSAYNPFADSAYPNFMGLRADGAARYANAKTLFQRAATNLINGYNLLVARSGDGIANHLIPQPPAGVDILGAAQLVQRSLNGEYVGWGFTNFYTNYNSFVVTNTVVTAYTNAIYTNYWIGTNEYSAFCSNQIWVNTNNYGYYGTNVYTNMLVMNGVSLGVFLDNHPSPKSMFFQLNAGMPVLYAYTNIPYDTTNFGMQVNPTPVSSPLAGSNYCLKLNDTTFGGLLSSGFTFYGPSSSNGFLPGVVPQYAPLVYKYNPAGDAWQNLIGAVPQLREPNYYYVSVNGYNYGAPYVNIHMDLDGYTEFADIYKSTNNGSGYFLWKEYTNTNTVFNSQKWAVFNGNGTMCNPVDDYEVTSNASYYYYVIALNRYGTNNQNSQSRSTYVPYPMPNYSSSSYSSSSSSYSTSGSSSSTGGTGAYIPDSINYAPNYVVIGCKDQLEGGYLDSANDMCSNALLLYPGDSRLHFMYALTMLSRIIGSPAVSNFADSIGFTGLPTSFSNVVGSVYAGNQNMLYNSFRYLGQPLSNYTNMDAQLDTEMLYLKNVHDVQDLISDTLLFNMQRMLDSLAVVETDPYFQLDIDISRIVYNLSRYPVYGGSVWKLDSAEALALDTGVSALSAMLNVALAWDLDIDWRKLVAMTSNSVSNTYNPFVDPVYTNFMGLRPNGAANYATAKTLFQRAASKAISGYTFLTNRSDTAVNHLIPQPPAGVDIVGGLGKLQRSLSNEYVGWGFTNIYTNSYGASSNYQVANISSIWTNTTNYWDVSNYVYVDYPVTNYYYNTSYVYYTITNVYTNMGGISAMSLGAFLDNHPAPRSLFFWMDGLGQPALFAYIQNSNMDSTNYGMTVNPIAVTTPSQGSNYCLKFMDANWGGLFNSSTYFTGPTINGQYAEWKMPVYVPVVHGYNPEGNAWQNFIGAVPQVQMPKADLWGLYYSKYDFPSASIRYETYWNDMYAENTEIYRATNVNGPYDLIRANTNNNSYYDNFHWGPGFSIWYSGSSINYDYGVATNGVSYYYYEVSWNKWGTNFSHTNSLTTY